MCNVLGYGPPFMNDGRRRIYHSGNISHLLLFTLLSILQYQKYSKPSIVKTSEISSQTYTASTDKIDGK